MTQAQAEALLSALEDAFDKRYRPEQRALYVRELLRLDLDDEGSKELFRRLVFGCDRLPSLKDILRAVEAGTEETREVARSSPRSAASEAALQRSAAEYLALEPLLRNRELYAEYLEAYGLYRAGAITREQLRAEKERLLALAVERQGKREAVRA